MEDFGSQESLLYPGDGKSPDEDYYYDYGGYVNIEGVFIPPCYRLTYFTSAACKVEDTNHRISVLKKPAVPLLYCLRGKYWLQQRDIESNPGRKSRTSPPLITAILIQ